MSLDPARISRIIAILEQPDLEDFEALVRQSGLDPSRAFRRANLTGVDLDVRICRVTTSPERT